MAIAACATVAGCERDGSDAGATTIVDSVAEPPPASGTTAATRATTSTSASTSTSSSTSTSTSSSTSSTTTTTTATTITTSTPTVISEPATTTTTTAPVGSPSRTGPIWEIRPPSDIPPPAIPDDWTVAALTTSGQGRPVEVWSRQPAGATRRVVVVGGVHGNEPVSPPIVRSLVDVAYPDDVAVWLVPELNPDGVAAGTRVSGADVDLNRNFPWRWWPSDGGPAPLSEPETAAVAQLVRDAAPTVVVWVHQPLGYVSSIGSTPDLYEQVWSQASGVPVRPDVTQHGGGESWTNLAAGFPSMLVEVDGWDATPDIVAAHRAGFEALLTVL